MSTKTDREICDAAIAHIEAGSPGNGQSTLVEFKARFDVFKIEEMLDKIETEKMLEEAASGLLGIIRDRYAAVEKLNADLVEQRDSARRAYCTRQSLRSKTISDAREYAERLASNQGWNCFEKE